MEYKGKLYGHLGGKMHFDTGKTADDWDALEKRVAELEAENQALRQPPVIGSVCDGCGSKFDAMDISVGVCYCCQKEIKQTYL